MVKHDHHGDERPRRNRSRSCRRSPRTTRATRPAMDSRDPPRRHRTENPSQPEPLSQQKLALQSAVSTAKTQVIQLMEDISVGDLSNLLFDNSITMNAIQKIFDINSTALKLREHVHQADLFRTLLKSFQDAKGDTVIRSSEALNWFTPSSLAVPTKRPGCTVYEFIDMMDRQQITENGMYKILEDDTVDSIKNYRRTFEDLQQAENQLVVTKTIAVKAKPKSPRTSRASSSTAPGPARHDSQSTRHPASSHRGDNDPRPAPPAPTDPTPRPSPKPMPRVHSHPTWQHYGCRLCCACGGWCAKEGTHTVHLCRRCMNRAIGS